MTTPTVRRIRTERGSHIEPALDPGWSDLDKLRWHLAVVLHDNEQPADLMRVEPGKFWIDGQRIWDAYTLIGRRGSYGSGGYVETWSLINGIDLGMKALR